MTASTNKEFTWTTFYMEFADKLLFYKEKRTELLSILETVYNQTSIKNPFTEHGQPLDDICPFTVFGAFNKGITTGNRVAIMKAIAEKIKMNADVPLNFEGIPVLNNQKAWFFRFKADRGLNDINNLWNLFEAAINFADNYNKESKESFILWYNTVIKMVGIKWNITMGLYWTRPFCFLNLDERNRQYLTIYDDTNAIGITDIHDFEQLPEAEKYLNLIEICKTFFSNDKNVFHSFPQLSYSAWIKTTSVKQDKEISKASFIQWFKPLVDALKQLGGEATPELVRKQIITNLNLSDEIINETRGKTQSKKFDNDVAWARNYLVHEGIIDKSRRGIWALTEKGKNITMTDKLASDIFYKWTDILKERREDFQFKDDPENRQNEKHYWIYAPGKGARKWEEYYQNNIMGIGWDYFGDLGDLSMYSSREEIRTKMKELAVENGSNVFKNDSLALWQFSHDILIGDIIFVKKGMFEIIGRGVVESDYVFMPERNEHKHIRKVKWTHNGNWEHPGQAVLKTLTDITYYTEYVQKLELLITEDDVIENLKSDDEINYDEYTENDFLNEVFMEPEQYKTLIDLLKIKKNLILQGAPGVGKTFIAELLAFSIINSKDTNRVNMVQFHQSYSYEDFIMGFRPTNNGFDLSYGPFYKFCKKAEDDLERDYFFIIDEINRSNLSKVFGELLMLIENDKRGKKLRLLYKDELFSVPKNVYIIGLMNTADKSLAMIDYALRRRFVFFDIEPAFDSSGFQTIIENSNNNQFVTLINRVKQLNEAISRDESLGDGFRIGHSYFCTNKEITNDWLASVVNFEILPLLNEYWFDEKSKIEDWTARLRGALK